MFSHLLGLKTFDILRCSLGMLLLVRGFLLIVQGIWYIDVA